MNTQDVLWRFKALRSMWSLHNSDMASAPLSDCIGVSFKTLPGFLVD